MKIKTPIIAIIISLILINIASAVTIEQTKIIPTSETIQGSIMYFCADITSTGIPIMENSITFPDNITKKYSMTQIGAENCFENATGNYQFIYQFEETTKQGLHKILFEAKKGVEYDSKNKTFLITPIGLVIDAVEYVSQVGTVGKVTDQPALSVFGTEYQVGDQATIFAQLIEGEKPVIDGVCYIDIYNPDKTQLLEKAPMVFLTGSDGLYYYDIIIPEQTGVYMLSIECDYAYETKWYNVEGHEPYWELQPLNYSLIKGTLTGSTVNLNSYIDGLYVKHEPDNQKITDIIFRFNFTETNITNLTSASFYYMGESSATNTQNVYFYNFNISQWIIMNNLLTYHATLDTTTENPSGIDELFTATSDGYNIEHFLDEKGLMWVRLNSTYKSTYTQFYNFISIRSITPSPTAITEIRGGGELHVTTHLIDIQEQLEDKGIMEVYGTEYQTGDEGRVFLQLTTENDQAINDAICELTVYYPNNTMLFDRTIMMKTSDDNGLYYYDFTIPNTTGVYMVSASCDSYSTYNQQFLINNYTVYNGSEINGDLQDLLYDDGQDYEIKETATIPYTLNITFQWTNITTGTSIEQIKFTVNYEWDDDNEDLILWFYNWTSGEYVAFNQTMPKSGETYYYATLTTGFDDIVNNFTDVKARITDEGISPDNDKKRLKLDQIKIDIISTGALVDDIRGSGELHVTDHLIEIRELLDGLDLNLENISIDINSSLEEIKTLIIEEHNLTNQQIYELEILINQSKINITSEINYVQEQITQLSEDQEINYNLTIIINNTLNTALQEIYNLNNTIYNQLNITNELIQNEFYTLTQNITGEFNGINNQLANILTQIQIIIDYVSDINQTVTEIKSIVELIDERIINLSQTLNISLEEIKTLIIDEHNLTNQQIAELEILIQEINYNITTDLDLLENLINQVSTKADRNYNLSITINNTINNILSEIYDLDSDITNNFNITNERITNEINQLQTNMTNEINKIKNDILNELEIIKNSWTIIFGANEFYINDTAEIDLQIRTFTGETIKGANCEITTYYPNKTLYNYGNATEFQDGIYYHQFATNEEEGIYIVIADCQKNSTQIQAMQVIKITEEKSMIQKLLDWIMNLIDPQLDDIEYKIDLLLEQSNITQEPISINATSQTCITGSDWIITATVIGHFNEILTDEDINCNITTSLWGLNNMNYTNGLWEYRNTCPTPQNWNWTIDCE